MLDLSLLRMPTMTPSLLASFFQGLANFAVLFLVIMYLQGARGLTPLHASLLLVPGYLVGAAPSGRCAGRLADRFGPVIPATVGLRCRSWPFSSTPSCRLTTGLWVVVVASLVNGLGASASSPPTPRR